MEQIFTIGQVLEQIEKKFNNPKALINYIEGEWKSISTKDFLTKVKYTAFGLLSIGVKRGDRVGIVALPSAEWTIADYAIMAIGAISVPLFANISEDNFHFEIEQSGLKNVFVGGAEQWKRSEQDQALFDHIIDFDAHHETDKEISFSRFLEMGKNYEKTLPEGAYLEILRSVSPTDPATIIYTSGSTGVPKGALHTHHSLTSLLHTPIFSWDSKNDSYLNFLPVAHVFARVLNLIMTSWGISCYYFNDVKNLGVACQEIKPTVMVVVPRLLEKMYVKMVAKVEASSPIKKAIGKFAFSLANQESGILKTLFSPLMDRLVYKTLRNALGGRLRVVFCGGAPLSPSLYHFFLEAGFPIYEGWGLTESCPICVNRPGNIKVGTVGNTIEGMQVKLGPDGELLVKGEMMMREYYKNPEKTAQTIDGSKWLHTGDKGSIDAEGHVTIIGRLKELYKSSTGEWIAPVPIEQALTQEPFIETAMVIAENRKFVSCLIVPDFDALKLLKQKQRSNHLSDEEFLNSSFMKSKMKEILDTLNHNLNEWEQIKSYRFIPHTLSIEEGELTPSMKVKRDRVESKYKDLIDSMYLEGKPE